MSTNAAAPRLLRRGKIPFACAAAGILHRIPGNRGHGAVTSGGTGKGKAHAAVCRRRLRHTP